MAPPLSPQPAARRPLIPDSPVPLVKGARLGKYQLLRRVAAGGMAEIFLATAVGVPGFDKLIAIKRILPRLAQKQQFVDMFLDEARIAATLQHENVVQVYDVGIADGNYYMAMEYLHGRDLNAIMRQLAAVGGGLPIRLAVEVVAAVSAGLHYAHEKLGFDGQPLRVVHRDVSPQNVIVTFDGGVKLLDFGIAKAHNRLGRTQFGTLKGKAAYMSPEQCRSEPLDLRSDIFSAGVVLYELAVSRRLFRAESEYDTMRRIVDGTVPPPSSIRADFPAPLEAVVMRALAKDREARYQSAAELGAALAAAAEASGLLPEPGALRGLMADLFKGEVEALQQAERAGVSPAEHFEATLPDVFDRPASEDDTDGEAAPVSPAARRELMRLGSFPEDEAELMVTAQLRRSPTPVMTPAPANAVAPAAPVEVAPWLPAPPAPAPPAPSLPALSPRMVRIPAPTPGTVLQSQQESAPEVEPDAPRAELAPERSSRTAEIRLPVDVKVTAPRLAAPPAVVSIRPATAALLLTTGLGLGLLLMWLVLSGRALAPVAVATPLAAAHAESPAAPATSAAALGIVTIETSPPGAIVYLDGRRREQTTPATFDRFPAGEHVLLLEREGFDDVVEKFTLQPSDVARLGFALHPIAPGAP